MCVYGRRVRLSACVSMCLCRRKDVLCLCIAKMVACSIQNVARCS